MEVDAQQARKDIESLVNILSFYKSRNPALVITIENPKGYLHHHPCSGRECCHCCLSSGPSLYQSNPCSPSCNICVKVFGTILGLGLVSISYCQFSRGYNIYPQKDTLLWTNSDLLLHAFGSGGFECTQNKECIGRVDGKHLIRAQDLPGKCASYPPEMCAFIAPLLCKCRDHFLVWCVSRTKIH